METPKPEICTIRIMFPVESDDHAIVYKKKIAEVLSDNPDAQIQFTLMNTPFNPNLPRKGTKPNLQ